MSFNKSQLLLKQRNAFDSRNSITISSNRSRNKKKIFNKFNDINRDVFNRDVFNEKTKIYIIEKKEMNDDNDDHYN